jgi:hypothetical protein
MVGMYIMTPGVAFTAKHYHPQGCYGAGHLSLGFIYCCSWLPLVGPLFPSTREDELTGQT